MHLFALTHLESGTTILIEKNHVIEAKVTSWNVDSQTTTMQVGTSGNSLNEFLQKGLASVGPERYFIYDSKTQNCQYFIQWNLRANGLWSDTVSKFVMQDAASIYKNLGLLEKVNRHITDFAGKADRALFGAGKTCH